MNRFNYLSTGYGTITLIKISGNLDIKSASDFHSKLKKEALHGVNHIVCNLKYLDYISSAGLGALISVNDYLSKQGGDIRISAINNKVWRTLTLLGFDKLFHYYKSDREAMNDLIPYVKHSI